MISFVLTAPGKLPVFFHCFRSFSATPWFHTKRHYLSRDEVMTEKSVAVTLTWHGVKISKWKPTNGAPQAVMFQHETRLPLMWSVFWNKESGSFDVHFFPSFALNGWKWIFSSKLDKSVLPLDVFEGTVHLPSKPRSNGVVANTRFLKSDYVLSSFPTLGWAWRLSMYVLLRTKIRHFQFNCILCSDAACISISPFSLCRLPFDSFIRPVDDRT